MVRTLMARGWLEKPEDLLCKNHVNRNLRVRADTKAAYPNRRLPNADPYCFFYVATHSHRSGGKKRSSGGESVSPRTSTSLSWSLRCRTLGRPEDVDTEGGSQELRPRSPT